MILIAESGSTKTDWVLVNDKNQVTMYKTMGFNPFFHSSEFIANEIQNNKEFYEASKNAERLYFYGAGCSSEEMNNIVKSGLSKIYPNSNVTVDHDLLACALSTYKGEPAISCILGTGSNSCYFDGENLREEVPAPLSKPSFGFSGVTPLLFFLTVIFPCKSISIYPSILPPIL